MFSSQITSNVTVCALLALTTNWFLTPFLSPLGLLFMRGKVEKGSAMLINAAFSMSYAVPLITQGLLSILAKDTHYKFGVVNFDIGSRDQAALALSCGLVLTFVYALPQLVLAIKFLREHRTSFTFETPTLRAGA